MAKKLSTVNGNPITGRELYSLFNAITNHAYSREAFVRRGEKRDIDVECGYPNFIDVEAYQRMYQRELGNRVVSFFPQECWKYDPTVYEIGTNERSEDDLDVDTPFEKAVKDLNDNLNLWHYFERADVDSRIGHFGLLFLGLNDGKGSFAEPVMAFDKEGQPVGGPLDLELKYLRVFSERLVSVSQWETDKTNMRYANPVMYKVKFFNPEELLDGGSPQPSDMAESEVHWTRVVHIAENAEVIAPPAQECVYNRLLDIRKVVGGSGEMFWQSAAPGIAFEVNPDIQDALMDPESIRQEFERYVNKLQKYIAVQGATVKSLSPQVADPEGHLMANLKLITINLGSPLRVFMGSEQAHLASSQDLKSWNGRVGRRQEKHCHARIIQPTFTRLIQYGCLPAPGSGKYMTWWPDLDTPSDKDKADVADRIMSAVEKYARSGASLLLTEPFFWTEVVGFDQDTAMEIVRSAEQQLSVTVEKNADMGLDPMGNPIPPEPVPVDDVPPTTKKKKAVKNPTAQAKRNTKKKKGII